MVQLFRFFHAHFPNWTPQQNIHHRGRRVSQRKNTEALMGEHHSVGSSVHLSVLCGSAFRVLPCIFPELDPQQNIHPRGHRVSRRNNTEALMAEHHSLAFLCAPRCPLRFSFSGFSMHISRIRPTTKHSPRRTPSFTEEKHRGVI